MLAAPSIILQRQAGAGAGQVAVCDGQSLMFLPDRP